MKTFIEDLKKSSYYKNLILKENIICLYIGGSHLTGFSNEVSDYDLIAITTDKRSSDASNSFYLTYKGTKVHWYYWSIEDLYKVDQEELWLIGSIYLKHLQLRPELIIYKNIFYETLLQEIFKISNRGSTLAIYSLFKKRAKSISRIISNRQVDEIDFTKFLYHLCIATSYLLNQQPKLTYILELKDVVKTKHLSENCKNYVIAQLEKATSFLKLNPMELNEESEKLTASLRCCAWK